MDSSAPGTATMQHLAAIVTAYLTNNHIPATELPDLIRDVHATVVALASGVPAEPAVPKPAVAVKKSVTPGYIVCLEDGQKLKMLKRYLRSRFNLTPEAYRARWNLPHDYPMVAPNYAALRSAYAKKTGLGKRTKRPGARAKAR